MKRRAGLQRSHLPIRNPVLGAWIAVTDLARRLGKAASGRTVLVAACASAALFTSPAQAAPDGGQVSAGTGAIAQTGTTTTITQQSQNLAIDWNSFSIAAGESVNFIQPNSSSIALNRILGTSPSEIYGSLSANGQVFILNPNGVLFGQGAQVNVVGMVASTLGLSNADFIAGNYRFSKTGTAGSVVNQGIITAEDNGYIALLAPEVRNEGVIIATLGTALLAAGDMVTLNLDNGSLLGYSVDQGALNALAENRQLIQADGGQVFMSARAADALSTAVVNNAGIIEARTVQNIGGVIKLMGDMQVGQVNVGGTLDASAPNGGNGGFIETSAAHVNVANDARITTLAAQGANGTWLIDPFDFTIAATGGNMTGAAVSSALALTDVTILSSNSTTGVNGDINVNDVVSWSDNKLTLNAQRNININASMNGSGFAQLALEYGQGAFAAGNTSSYVIAPNVQVNLPAGNNFSTKLGSNGSVINYTVITSLGAEGSVTTTDLQGMSGNLAGNYVLGANIDACATSGCGVPANAWDTGSGFVPIGDNSSGTAVTQFTGVFDGLGHTISNLTINRPSTGFVGLFGYAAAGSSIRNVGLQGGSVTGYSEVGGLAGYNSGTISNAYTTGNVSSIGNVVGGLVGFNAGTIISSYATGIVIGSSYVGGLVGTNYGSINYSHATGIVNGSSIFVGGLAGLNLGGTVNNSYATGSVSGDVAGGLVGQNDSRTIFDINGNDIGTAVGTISNSYASGSVTGSSHNGGLTGINYGTISTSYAAGKVTGTTYVGGVAGYNTGTISSSYWDTTTSTQATGIGGGTLTGVTGLTSTQMMTMASFSNWNIANTGGAGKVWRIYEGNTAPLLTSFLTPLTVTANNAVKTYDGNPYAGGNGVNYSDAKAVTNVNVFDSGIAYGGTSQGAVNAGGYTITVSGLYSNQQGYDIINYAPGTLTVSPYVVNLSGGRSYNGSSTISSADLLIGTLVGGDTLTLNGSGLMADKHAGTGKTIATLDTLALAGGTGLASNYTLAGGAHAVDIARAALSINAVSGSKVYDGTTASADAVSIGTLFGSDSVTGATQAFGSKDVLGTNGSTLIVTGYTVNDGNGGANYTVTSNTAAGTITPAPLTVTANDNGKVIGDSDPNFLTTTGVNYSGFVNSETSAALSGTLALVRVAGETAGTYNINASGLTPGNYTYTYVPGTFTIAPAGQLLIRMADLSAVYGVNQTSLTFTPDYAKYSTETSPGVFVVSDLLANQGTSNIGNAWTLRDGAGGGASFTASTNYVQGNSIGNYTVSTGAVTPIGTGNYSTLVTTNGTLTITPAPLAVSANSASKVYGSVDPILSYVSTGLYGTDTLTGTLSRAAGETVLGGPYAITQGTLANPNYTITYTGNNLTITPAALTVTANASTKTYDGLAYTGGNGVGYSGLVNGDTPAVLGTLTYSGTSQGAINAGTYQITPSGLTSGNYTISFVNGTLTVNTAPLTVFANSTTKTYGQNMAFSGIEFTAIGLQNGETIGNVTLTSAGTDATAGVAGGIPYTITTNTATGGTFNAANYNIGYVTGLLTVTPAALTVTASNATKIYGQTMTFVGSEFTATGLQNGETIGSVTLTSAGTAATASVAGSPYAISISGATGGTYNPVNYTPISYVNGALTVIPASQAAAALGGDTLVLAYNTAQQGIANTDAREASNPPGSSVEPIGIVGCGVTMPPDAPANTCKN